MCKIGRSQSPVNIQKAKADEVYTLKIDYKPVTLQVLNNGHTLQVNYDDKSSVSKFYYNDREFKLLQIHFHTPSEHAFEGKRYSMEAHLVHKSPDGQLAVIGVFLDPGRENSILQLALDNVSDKMNQITLVENSVINATSLLPDLQHSFHYQGSLTTPPCSENVNWFVMQHHIEISEEQLERFAKLIGENARPVQQLFDRKLHQSN